jgi:hypothetical protein
LFLQVVIQGIGKLFEGEAAVAGPATQIGLPSGSLNFQRAVAFGASFPIQAPAFQNHKSMDHLIILLCRAIILLCRVFR